MRKAQGNLIAAILFLLVAVLNLLNVDYSNVKLDAIVLVSLWLLASFFSFREYQKNKAKEENE